jgi:hypothetical protein
VRGFDVKALVIGDTAVALVRDSGEKNKPGQADFTDYLIHFSA